MERQRLPMVATSGQQRMFHAVGALALWISLIVGGIAAGVFARELCKMNAKFKSDR